MKKFSLKALLTVLIVGTIGATIVFAATRGISSVALSNARVTVNGTTISLDRPMAMISLDNEEHAGLYMPFREFLEYLRYVVEWDGAENTVHIKTQNETIPSPLTTTPRKINQINWNSLALSEIYDGEIFELSGSNQAWRDRFSVNGRLTTIQSTLIDNTMVRGIILFENQMIIVHNNQYIVLDDLDTINRIAAVMNIDFDNSALSMMEAFGSWNNIESYLPFLSNDTIGELVEMYNSTRPITQHKNASDYFN